MIQYTFHYKDFSQIWSGKATLLHEFFMYTQNCISSYYNKNLVQTVHVMIYSGITEHQAQLTSDLGMTFSARLTALVNVLLADVTLSSAVFRDWKIINSTFYRNKIAHWADEFSTEWCFGENVFNNLYV